MAEDHVAITSRIYQYAYGIDLKDWGLYRSIFTDEVYVDFSSYNDVPGATMTADAWVDAVKPLFTGLDATQHSMSNPLVEAVGDSARCRMYMQAAHFFREATGGSEYTIGGFYDDRLVRTPSGWQIEAVILNVLWHRGNASIMEPARQKGLKLLEG